VRRKPSPERENGMRVWLDPDELETIVDDDPEMGLYCDPIRDEGECGTGFDRECIKRVLALSEEDEVTHLIVDHVDRIRRSTPETVMFIRLLRKRGVILVSRSETLDMLVPSDRMRISFVTMMVDFATMHRSRSANRSKVQAVIDDQQWTSWFHTPPLGYEMDGDGWIT
jgi:DNA invertase Pin-like site-specific DNA recombinase